MNLKGGGEGGKKGGREGGREGRREGGREGGKKGGRETEKEEKCLYTLIVTAWVVALKTTKSHPPYYQVLISLADSKLIIEMNALEF